MLTNFVVYLGGVDMEKWSLWIDLEGFSHYYLSCQGGKALRLLSSLMLDLYKIGTKIYQDDENRLFIYQFGDGFIVCPYIGDATLVRPISVAIALMQSLASKDGFARAAISQGEIADVVSCYQKEITDNLKDGSVPLGRGIMTINPVLGDALINAHNLSMSNPKGPRLLLDIKMKSNLEAVAKNNVIIIDQYNDHVGIDWVRSKTKLAEDILNVISVDRPSEEILVKKIKDYISGNQNLNEEWKNSAEKLIRRE
jgi:hypothetical protein